MSINVDYLLASNIISAYRKETVQTMTDQIGSNDLDWSLEEWRDADILVGSASPQQGVARNSSNWFTSSSTNIKKYDLSWTEVASNTDPYAGITGAQAHIGDGCIVGSYFYLPIVKFDSPTQTSTDVVIARYNIADLTLDAFVNVDGSGFYGAGLSQSIDGSELLGVNFNTTVGSDKVFRFSLSTFSFLGTYSLSFPVLGMQGITQTPDSYLISSNDRAVDKRNLIYKFNSALVKTGVIVPHGISATSVINEIEGIQYYNGEIYTHLIDGPIRKLTTSFSTDDPNVASPLKFLDTPLAQGTILMKVTPKTFFNYNSLIDNRDLDNNWESWIYSDGRLAWRVNATGRTDYALSTANTEYILAMTWSDSGGTVTIKQGVNGIFVDTISKPSITPPSRGLFLAGYNDKNTMGNTIYSDITVYDKVLSDAEFLSVSNDYDQIYTTDSPVGSFSNRSDWIRATLGKDGNTNDLWIEYWVTQSVPSGQFNDMAYAWLGTLGFTNDLANRWFFWEESNLRGL